jgi:isopentenyl-diphosphate Delta-isomerase
MMIIPIVNEDDKIIMYKQRNDVLQEDIYRVSALWITNSKNEVLLAQRAFNKKHDPGRWGPSVAGTIEKGETYKSNIIKEAFEEIGLKDFKPKKGPKRRIIGKHNHFTQWYFLKTDKELKEFKFDTKEVADIRWIKESELVKDLKKNPSRYILSMNRIVDDFCR